jgi:hypothetical protein
VSGCGLDSTYWGLGPVAGFCEYGNENSSSIKGGKVFDHMRNYHLLRRAMFHGIKGLCSFLFSMTCTVERTVYDMSTYSFDKRLYADGLSKA